MTFETQLQRLEQIVAELESDEIELDRALALFEEGIKHLRAATDALAQAEARVQRLVERADGSFEVTDFRE